MNVKKKYLYLDIETDMAQSTIWCCCAFREDDDDVQVFTKPEALAEYITDDDIIVGHNIIGFDAHTIHRLWGLNLYSNKIIDTLVLSRLANPIREQGHSLKSWGIALGDNKGNFVDFNGGLTREMITYCKQDVKLLRKVHKALQHELNGFSEQSIELEHQVAFIIQDQVSNGFKINMKLLMSFVAELNDTLIKLEQDLQDTFGPTEIKLKTKTKLVPFNPGSRKQIADRLMQRGWKPQKLTDKGNIIVDDEVLATIDMPEARQLQEFLLVQKRLAQAKSWLEATKEDERVHGSVITIGANTGRMAHNKPNMAQVPAVRNPYGKVCRAIWTVDSGNVLVGADLSGIELRCFAHYLNDEGYINEIVYGDVHTRNQHLFGVATRDLAKTVLYAGLYGASPSKLALIVGGNTSDGNRLREGFNNIPGYTKLVSKIDRLAAKGWLQGLDGRRLIIRSQHAALNLLLQGAGAVIFKKWLVNIKKELTAASISYKLVASVHDEVQIETGKDRADEVGRLVVKAAVDSGVDLNFRCPVAAEYKVGSNWMETH
mgnify:CR=1 FL=1